VRGFFMSAFDRRPFCCTLDRSGPILASGERWCAMTSRDVSRPATVMWLPNDAPPAEGIEGIDTYRHFERLDEAVRFVMVELPVEMRQTAWIKPDDDGENLTIGEIETLYAELPPSDE
jgi:hypothetical protein